VPPTPVPFSIGGLVVGTTYFAVVLAVNAAGTGPASAEVSFVA
jgi:phosphate starvation-inducible protein PhoH